MVAIYYEPRLACCCGEEGAFEGYDDAELGVTLNPGDGLTAKAEELSWT